MDFNKITIRSFASVGGYCELQSYFQNLDTRENPYVKAIIYRPIKNQKIVYHTRDDISGEDIYRELSFNKDFCYEGLRDIYKRYVLDFKHYQEDKGIFEEKQLSALVESRLDTLREWKKQILKADYIEYLIKIRLRDVITDLEDFLSTYLADQNPNLDYKLRFNWKRTDVIYLFHLLRANGEIAPIADGDLGRILDSVIEYFDGESYKPIIGSRKLLNDFKNQGGKPEDPSNERLQAVFSNDFFNH